MGTEGADQREAALKMEGELGLTVEKSRMELHPAWGLELAMRSRAEDVRETG